MRIHADLHALAAGQDDIVAAWQLVHRGWTKDAIAHRTAGYERLHDGVFILSSADATQRQRWRAATLTAPHSALSHASGGSAWAFRPHSGPFETITRQGSGGPRRIGDVLVLRSTILLEHVTTLDGLLITTAARTLADLAPHLSGRALRKAFREALRLRTTTTADVARFTSRYPRRNGSEALAGVAEVYARLPIGRCKSDAEAMGLEVLDAAGVRAPVVNESFAGGEADFCWPDLRRIIEIDGPAFHRLRDDDARKTRAWRVAGFTVDRISSDDVFDRPERLLALAPRPA